MVGGRQPAPANIRRVRNRSVGMNDQRRYWNAIHERHLAGRRESDPAPLARECASLLPPRSVLLELGCGAGHDAAFFARSGHTVCATDFSAVALGANRDRDRDLQRLHFVVLDSGWPLPFAGGVFDAVYAHLSLHYFPDDATRALFRETWRVLRHGGLLGFICKSVEDPLYGQGRTIEPDMFEHEGHVRHFFSAAYAMSCLGPRFEAILVESGPDRVFGTPSAFVKVIARAV
jgi:SAM-dependent methyltransferase